MKVKELKSLPFSICGKVEVMHQIPGTIRLAFDKFENIVEAIKAFGESDVFQIFGSKEYTDQMEVEPYICIVVGEYGIDG